MLIKNSFYCFSLLQSGSRSHIFIIFTLLLSFYSPLYAQEDDDLLIFNDQADLLDEPFPVVLTASRLKQHKSRAPTSMTVIDKEMIVASGIREISELFRLVPGMKVSQVSGHQSTVSYHDIATDISRRLQVLIDGRSVYKPALAEVSWTNLPITIEDIQRIEVVRSPNAASYGANSFLGVINIITEHPDDVSGTQVSYTNGDTNIKDGFLRHSQRDGDFSWRVSLKQRNDTGFDTSKRPGKPETKCHDSKSVDVVNLRGVYDLNSNDYLDVSLGYSNAKKQGEQEVKPPEKYDDINTEEFYTHVLWHHGFNASHALETQFNYTSWNDRNDWTTGCTDPIFLGSAFCAKINHDLKQERMDLQIQDTYEVNDSLRFVAGGSVDVERAESETFLGGRVYNHRQRLFTNIEWQLMPDWLVNTGILVENDSIVDVSVEPRIAINYQFKAHHVFRYTWSKATRTPDLFEHDGKWNYTLSEKEFVPNNPFLNVNLIPPFPTLTPSDDAHEEKITSQEIAYIGSFPEHHLNIDMKIYRDAMRDLIYEGLHYNDGIFIINNSTDLNLTGFEVSADYSPLKSVRLIASYGYSHIHVLHGEDKDIIEDSVPDHTASLMGIFKLPDNWQLSSTYYYADTTTGYDEPGKWKRIDFRIAKQIKLTDKNHVVISAVVQHRLDNDPDFREENHYDSDNKIYASIGLSF